MAAGAAHDFNNLLTVVLGHTSQLPDEVNESHLRRAEADALI
jgi:hypothetical protein